MKKFLLVTPLILVLCGCNRTDMMPFLGKWLGRFEVTDIVGGGSPSDMKREQLRGFVQVYATEHRYKMEMEGEQETIAISGTWSFKGNRITLHPGSVSIDDQGGADKRDPNKKFIPSADAEAAYSRPLVLQEAHDKKSLKGLKVSIGKLIGVHSFVKDSF